MKTIVSLFGSTGGISTALRNKFIDENQEVELISRNQLPKRTSTSEQSFSVSNATVDRNNPSTRQEYAVNGIFLSHSPQEEKSNQDYFKENLDLLKRSLDYWSNRNGTRFIFASSSAVYGTSKDVPLQESTPPTPENIYGELKLLSEQYLLHEFKETSAQLTILRIFNVFGPGMNKSFINKIYDSLPHQEIMFLGTSNFKRDYIEVSDVAEAMFLATQCSRIGETILNVASGNPISNTELSQWTSLHKESTIQILACEDSFSTADTSLADRELNFRYRTSVWDYLNQIKPEAIDSK